MNLLLQWSLLLPRMWQLLRMTVPLTSLLSVRPCLCSYLTLCTKLKAWVWSILPMNEAAEKLTLVSEAWWLKSGRLNLTAKLIPKFLKGLKWVYPLLLWMMTDPPTWTKCPVIGRLLTLVDRSRKMKGFVSLLTTGILGVDRLIQVPLTLRLVTVDSRRLMAEIWMLLPISAADTSALLISL